MPVVSSIWIVKEGREPWAKDENGNEIVGQLQDGYKYLTRSDLPATPNPNAAGRFHVLHGRARAPTPAKTHSVVAERAERPWASVGIPPWVHDFVYEAQWEEEATDPETGETTTYPARGKMAEIPDGVTPTETDLWPHVWQGEMP